MNTKEFLKNSEHTGRHIVVSRRTGRKYYIEPITPHQKAYWGDVNVATKKVEGNYGRKYKGSVDESESMLVGDNIYTANVGESPYSVIEKLDSKYPDIEKN